MQQNQAVRISLMAIFLIVLYFVFRIFQPFVVPLCLAAIVATLCYPVFDWISGKLRGRRGWAALLTSIGITTIIIVPFVVMLILLAGEAAVVYRQFQQRLARGDFKNLLSVEESPYLGPLVNWAGQYVDLESIDLLGSLASGLQKISSFFLRQSTALLSGFFSFLSNFLIMLVTMFFLFRDGSRVLEELKSWTPLSEEYEGLIMDTFRGVARATVLGTLLTALAQGFAGGLLFLLVGVPNSIFWGFLMGLFSLVPVVGTGIIWAPWALYFLGTGLFLKAILLVVGGFLVGVIDNVLRPMFIEGSARMHSLIVFLSLLGGISYFGLVGMIFGPIVVALGLTCLELYKVEFKRELSKPTRQ